MGPDAAPGYVFLCNHLTQEECVRNRLCGAPRRELGQMNRCITKDTKIFMLNINSRELLGVFRTHGCPDLDIDPDAFDGRFRAQVRIVLPEELSKASLTC